MGTAAAQGNSAANHSINQNYNEYSPSNRMKTET
jgi:hypothetical protein